MGFVINGADEVVPDIACASWLEDRTVLRLRRSLYARTRPSRWVRGIVLHASRGFDGLRHDLRPGCGSPTARELRALSTRSTVPTTGAHLLVDHDGSVTCAADLLSESAFHAGPVNDVTIGVEIYQGDEGEIYERQLDRTVRLIDWLTLRFRIQRQVPRKYLGVLTTRMVKGGRDVVGVYGRRDVTNSHGAGDPGDQIFHLLAAGGYERWDFEAAEDLIAWRARQAALVRDTGATIGLDGIPGPGTCAALRAAGYVGGLWVSRPRDG